MKNDTNKQLLDSQESTLQKQKNIENIPSTPEWEKEQLTSKYKEELLETIQWNPFIIKIIENPTKDVQLAAIRQNPDVIKYIKDQSREAAQEILIRLSKKIQ